MEFQAQESLGLGGTPEKVREHSHSTSLGCSAHSSGGALETGRGSFGVLQVTLSDAGV